MSEKIHVLDSTAFFAGIPFQGEGRYYTTYHVMDEVGSRGIGAQLIHSRVQVTEPSKASLQKVKQVSSKTGDLKSLSEADSSILAVSLDLASSGSDVTLVTDDFAVRNVAEALGHRSLGDKCEGRVEADHLGHLLQGLRKGVLGPQDHDLRRLRDETLEKTEGFLTQTFHSVRRTGTRWKWTGGDLNPRPPPCEGGILPD